MKHLMQTIRLIGAGIMLASMIGACAANPTPEAAEATEPPTQEATSTATDVPATESPTDTPAPTATPTPVALEEIADGLLALTELSQLQALFNADEGSPRLVLFLTTGCPSCMRGAEWINKNLLEADPNTNLKVYAIWFPSVQRDLLPAGVNPRWDAARLTDSRVVHLWDEDLVAAGWFAENQPYEGEQHASMSQGFGNVEWGEAVWDIYFLYGADAAWQENLTAPIDAHYPILPYRNTLREQVGIALEPLPESAATVYSIVPDESLVSYGVDETLMRNHLNYAIGTTNEVSGDITLNLDNPSLSQVGAITVNIESFESDNVLRDERIKVEFLESATYPTATFTPTEIRGLPTAAYTSGEVLTFEMVGNLTVRQITIPVTFQVEARVEGGRLIGTATAQIKMTDFGFDPPKIADVIAARNAVDLTIEFVAEPKE